MSVLKEREYKTEIVSRNDDANTHTFVISDESIDSFKTSFRLRGWKFDRFINNPIVTYGHPDPNSTDPNLIIGRAKVFIEGDKLMAEVEYDMGNPLAVEVKRKVEQKFLNMTSIRAYVNDAERGIGDDREVLYFIDQELLDFGIVMHGSNRNAMAQRDIMMSQRNIMLALGKEDNDPIPGDNTDTILTDHTDEDQAANTENAARLEEARELLSKTFFNLKKVQVK